MRPCQRAHYKHVIDKASTGRLDHSVQCCADLIRELVMVREGLLVLSDSRISKDDISAAIEYLCVERRCNCVMLFLLFFCVYTYFVLRVPH